MSEPELVGMDLQPLATRAREQMRVRQNKIRSFMILRFAFSTSCRFLKEPALAGPVQYTSSRRTIDVGRDGKDGNPGWNEVLPLGYESKRLSHIIRADGRVGGRTVPRRAPSRRPSWNGGESPRTQIGKAHVCTPVT